MRFNGDNVRTGRVAVVAAGVVSPLGIGLGETLESLLAARDCVTPVDRFDVERCRCKTAAQVALEALKPNAYSSRTRPMHPASHMMIGALAEALEQCPSFRPQLTVIG